MKTNYSNFFRKLASLAYSAGAVSLIIGILLSSANQPVFASNQTTIGGGDHKIWICHVPPGNPGNAQALNVDADGWDGHDNHSGDFQISGPNDQSCGGQEDPTNTPKPTQTSEPTEVEETETSVPTVGQESTLTLTPTLEDTAVHKIWICHVPSGNPDNPQALNVDENGWNGHDGHALDFIINGPDDPRCGGPTATPTPTDTVVVGITFTPTETPTEVPTETSTATVTETATSTATPTAIEISFKRLSVDWECVQGQQLWTITNPNPFPVNIDWSFSSGPGPGSATVPANSSINFYVAGGYRTITVTWNDGKSNQSLSSTTSPTSPCATNQNNTPTPTSVGNNDPTTTPTTPGTTVKKGPASTPRPTFVATLAATVDPSQEVLIPVTGADFSNPFSNMPLSSIFLNLGFVFLGMAFLTHGMSFKLK